MNKLFKRVPGRSGSQAPVKYLLDFTDAYDTMHVVLQNLNNPPAVYALPYDEFESGYEEYIPRPKAEPRHVSFGTASLVGLTFYRADGITTRVISEYEYQDEPWVVYELISHNPTGSVESYCQTVSRGIFLLAYSTLGKSPE